MMSCTFGVLFPPFCPVNHRLVLCNTGFVALVCVCMCVCALLQVTKLCGKFQKCWISPFELLSNLYLTSLKPMMCVVTSRKTFLNVVASELDAFKVKLERWKLLLQGGECYLSPPVFVFVFFSRKLSGNLFQEKKSTLLTVVLPLLDAVKLADCIQ